MSRYETPRDAFVREIQQEEQKLLSAQTLMEKKKRAYRVEMMLRDLQDYDDFKKAVEYGET